MTGSDFPDRAGAPTQTKVGRLIVEYDLGDIGDELERRWIGEGRERDSLRTLADVFNRRLLSRAMADAGMDPLDGEVENIYRLLTNDEISRGIQIETEAKLRQAGIDVEPLVGDFVTYQAIRTYLKDVRDVSYDRDSSGIDTVQSAFDRLIGRATAVVEQKLRRLRSTDVLVLGEFHVQTTITVYCEDCETQYDVASLLGRGECACGTSSRE